MTTIPYTHWMYFADREAAEECAAELSGLNFLCGVDFSPPPSEEEKARLAAEHPALADLPESWPHGDWLLRAARETTDTIAQHQLVEKITTRHGGFYDGGETGLMDPEPDSSSARLSHDHERMFPSCSPGDGSRGLRRQLPGSHSHSVCAGSGGGRESNPPTTRRAVHRF